MKRSQNHWLGAVADILRANTSSLRELATAAGRDPGTFYLGSNLAGADLRGQDLRGMRFSAPIDRSTVLIDAGTQLDPEMRAVFSDSASVQALIWLQDEDYELGQILKQRLQFPVTFFGGSEIQTFATAAQNSQWPAFAIMHASTYEFASEHFITIRAIPERDFEAGRLLARRTSRGAVVVAPYAAQSEQVAFSGPVQDLIELFIDNWGFLSDYAQKARTLTFMRERGAGPNPLVDAEAKLFRRAVLIGVGGQEGLAIPFDGSFFAEELLPDHERVWLNLPRGASRRYRAATFSKIDGPLRSRNSFRIALKRCLAEQGWLVRDYESVEGPFLISSPRKEYVVEIAMSIGAAAQPRAHRRAVAFEKIEKVVVHPWLTDRELARRLRPGELTVCVAELLLFRPDSASLWTLLDLLAQRMALSRDARARTDFFSVLLRTALTRTKRDLQMERSQIQELIDHPQLGFDVKMIGGAHIGSSYELTPKPNMQRWFGNEPVRFPPIVMTIEPGGIDLN